MASSSPWSLTSSSFGNAGSLPAARLRARVRARLRQMTSTSKGRLALGGGCASLGGMVCLASASHGMQDLQLTKRQRGPLDFGSPLRRVTDTLLVANLAAFVLQWVTKDALTVWGAKVNSLIMEGQLWRLATPAFLHSGLIHLLINCHALHTLGPHLEMLAGPQRMAATYAVAAVAGTVASVVGTPAPSVGASAAIFGLGAALGVFYWRHKEQLGRRSDSMLASLGVTLGINLAYSLLNKRIDNWGHLGGMLGGAAVAYLLGPRLVREGQAVLDRPPWPILAYQGRIAGGSSKGSSGSNSSAAGSPPSNQQPHQQPQQQPDQP